MVPIIPRFLFIWVASVARTPIATYFHLVLFVIICHTVYISDLHLLAPGGFYGLKRLTICHKSDYLGIRVRQLHFRDCFIFTGFNRF
jgi:predicted permease